MKYINYQEDFKLTMQLRDADGGPCAVPDFDFTIRLKAGPREYFAGRFEGELKNCRVSDTDMGILLIVCDNHRLLPCRELIAEVTYHLPDGDHPDGERSTTAVYHTGISLTMNESSVPSKAEFEALLPYITGPVGPIGPQGEQGPAGESARWSDLTDEERAEFRDAILAEIGYELVATEEDIERMWEEIEKENGD